MALAVMGEEEFERRLAAMKKGQERVRRIQLELMSGPTPEEPEGEDYGVIPGTKKPTLLKPGAEKICNVYGLVPSFQDTWIEGDGVTTPHLRVRMKCFLHRGDTDGPVVAQGVGAANSWERKHRYRGGQRTCPGCGCEGTIRRSRFADKHTGDKGWYCHDKSGGCGETYASNDPRVAEQQVGMVENPDPYDVENTLLKMAKKRSHVDATLTATATSGLFTQDVEDMVQPDPPPSPTTTQAPPQQREPGEDNGFPDESQAAYQRHGVEPARPSAAPAAARGGREVMPSCPQGHPPAKVMRSKRGSGYYCHECRAGFGG